MINDKQQTVELFLFWLLKVKKNTLDLLRKDAVLKSFVFFILFAH